MICRMDLHHVGDYIETHSGLDDNVRPQINSTISSTQAIYSSKVPNIMPLKYIRASLRNDPNIDHSKECPKEQSNKTCLLSSSSSSQTHREYFIASIQLMMYSFMKTTTLSFHCTAETIPRTNSSAWQILLKHIRRSAICICTFAICIMISTNNAYTQTKMYSAGKNTYQCTASFAETFSVDCGAALLQYSVQITTTMPASTAMPTWFFFKYLKLLCVCVWVCRIRCALLIRAPLPRMLVLRLSVPPTGWLAVGVCWWWCSGNKVWRVWWMSCEYMSRCVMCVRLLDSFGNDKQ